MEHAVSGSHGKVKMQNTRAPGKCRRRHSLKDGADRRAEVRFLVTMVAFALTREAPPAPMMKDEKKFEWRVGEKSPTLIDNVLKSAARAATLNPRRASRYGLLRVVATWLAVPILKFQELSSVYVTNNSLHGHHYSEISCGHFYGRRPVIRVV